MSEATDKISIRYTLTDADLEHMVMQSKTRFFGWTGRTKTIALMVYLLLLVAILSYFLPSLLGYPPGAEDRWILQLSIGLTGAVLVALYPTFQRWAIKRSSKAYQTLPLDFHLWVGEQGVDAELEGQSGHTAWRVIERAVETDSHFILYLNRLRGFVIPKAAFQSEADKARLRALITAHVATRV